MNVVLLSAHGLNAHWLSPFGNEWVSMPAFDRLASTGICFDQHIAEEPTLAGYRRWLHPLVEQLKSAGVYTVLLDDLRTDRDRSPCWAESLRPSEAPDLSAAETRVAAFEDIATQLPREQPWFWHIETDRLLPPWDADLETYLEYAQNVGGFTEGSESEENPDPTPWNDPPQAAVSLDEAAWHRLRNTFATTLSGFDAELEMLLDILHEQDHIRRTALIVTSGYGLALGEHGLIGPAVDRLHEAFIHVPLILSYPKAEKCRRRVEGFTQGTDIATAIRAFLGQPAERPTLIDIALGQSSARTFARCGLPTNTGLSSAIRLPGWAYLRPTQGDPLLFQKPDDRWEVSDCSRANPGVCDELEALLKEPTKETNDGDRPAGG